MIFRTTDTALATFIAMKHGRPVLIQSKDRGGRAWFLVLNTTEEEGAALRQEFMESEFFAFEARRRAFIQDIPQATPERIRSLTRPGGDE